MNYNIKNIIGAGLISLAFFLFFVAVFPGYTSIQNTREVIKQREDVVLEKNKAIERASSLNEQYVLRKNDIEKLAVIVPESKKLEDIISSISVVGQQNNMQIKNFTTSVDAPAAGDANAPRVVSVKLNVTLGQYLSLPLFLKDIEKNLRVLDVKEIFLSEEASQGGRSLTAQISIDGYFLK